MKLKGAKNLHKNDRKTIRRTYMDFQKDKNLQSALPELDTGLLSRNFLLWSNEEYLNHLNLINTLHGQLKKELDDLLSKAKQLHKEHCKEKVFQTPIGSKARQTHQLLNKNASFALPATMKHPDDPSKLVRSHDNL
jgi:hypothetical protein